MSSFHLPTSEVTVTLEDVYRILRLLIRGARAMYDTKMGFNDMHRYYPHDDIRYLWIDHYEIRCHVLVERYGRLDCLLCTLIRGVFLPNCRGHGFLVGWGEMCVGMLERRVVCA